VRTGLSKREIGFYGRTIERMVAQDLMHKEILDEFKRNYLVQDSPT
jgi:hypothetical protein